MASYRAIAAVCEAILQLLRANYRPELFDHIELDFKVFTSQDFSSPMQAGVSLFVYRLQINGTFRNPPGRLLSGGQQQKTRLPVEVHFLLTIWGRDASLQNSIAGWVMRTLEDHPLLPSGLLNTTYSGVFRGDETVEIVEADLSTQDLIHMWDRLSERGLSLSIPYVARVVQIESAQLRQ